MHLAKTLRQSWSKLWCVILNSVNRDKYFKFNIPKRLLVSYNNLTGTSVSLNLYRYVSISGNRRLV